MAQGPLTSPIPPFRPDGYLPEGVHVCSEADVIFRLGSSNRRRRRLALRLRQWIELGGSQAIARGWQFRYGKRRAARS
jgi:hypothetical protein